MYRYFKNKRTGICELISIKNKKAIEKYENNEDFYEIFHLM
jgi:hypothetical protein